MTKITEDEWRAEIDKFHKEIIKNNQTRYSFTDEQIEYIKYCRAKDPPISFKNIAILFNKRGWRASHTSLLCKSKDLDIK